MKRTLVIAIGTLALVSCGSKTVYVTQEAPTTTVKVVKTTDAPIATPAPITAPPASWSAEDEFIADINSSYTRPIYIDDQAMIDAGYATCTALVQGSTGYEVLDAIVSSADGDSDIEELLGTVVASAVVNFCPEQQYKFDN